MWGQFEVVLCITWETKKIGTSKSHRNRFRGKWPEFQSEYVRNMHPSLMDGRVPLPPLGGNRACLPTSPTTRRCYGPSNMAWGRWVWFSSCLFALPKIWKWVRLLQPLVFCVFWLPSSSVGTYILITPLDRGMRLQHEKSISSDRAWIWCCYLIFERTVLLSSFVRLIDVCFHAVHHAIILCTNKSSLDIFTQPIITLPPLLEDS